MRFRTSDGLEGSFGGHTVRFAIALALALATVTGACSEEAARTRSVEQWLRPCQSPTECGDLDCVCGLCTARCQAVTEDITDNGCDFLGEAICTAPDQVPGAVCTGTVPQGLCVFGCTLDADCVELGEGFYCLNRTCVAPDTPVGECFPEHCGPPPNIPNIVCPDGRTVAGPTGNCIETESGCTWEVISCP